MLTESRARCPLPSGSALSRHPVYVRRTPGQRDRNRRSWLRLRDTAVPTQTGNAARNNKRAVRSVAKPTLLSDTAPGNDRPLSASAVGHFYEGILRHNRSPTRRNRTQFPLGIVEIYPVLAPLAAISDH